MIYSDFHMHTTFCDGHNTPEEMVLSGIEKGLKQIGICAHSYQFFDEGFCIKKDKVSDFISEVNAQKEKYKDKIRVYCGVEQEFFSDTDSLGFDYVIGSCDYIKKDGKYLDVDYTADIFRDNVLKFFDGDFYAYCEAYYETLADVVEKTGCDIIGHFDIVAKFNEGGVFFDEKHPRYVSAYRKAVDKLIKYGVPFEINTGAISRGYKTLPYPSGDIIDYIISKGGKFILSSDAHSAENICFQFDICEEIIDSKNALGHLVFTIDK